MKIGLSYSRCVRDIVDGVVDNEQWQGIWQGYHQRGGWSNPEWGHYAEEDEDRFRSVSIELWETGKLHQPRKFGAHPSRRPEIWLEAVLPSSELKKNPAAKIAWDKFQTVAGLTNVNLDKEYK